MLEGTLGGFYFSLVRVDLVELGKKMETAQIFWAPKRLTALMVEQVSP